MMEKIAISKIIEFRRKSEASRLTLINNIKKPKQEKSSSGGDYWITSMSTIANSYKSNNNTYIFEKITDLLERTGNTDFKISKSMYERNIEILHNFEDFDFTTVKPKFDLNYISKPNNISIITIDNLPIQVLPHHVFTYKENEIDKIGGIWFVAKLNGYELGEIGIYSEALFKYLNKNYSDRFQIDSEFCIALDVVSLNKVNHKQILQKEIPILLNNTLELMKKLI